MFNRAQEIWDNWGFEIILGICLAFLGIYALFRLGRKGSWSSSYTYIPPKKSSGRTTPKESSGEKECRRVLESIFKKPFPKARPDFLRNPVTGNNFNLELDCFNTELNLACEYSGQQHYKYTPFFHKNKEAFHNQKYRDYMKKTMCERYGVNLIEVPYTVKTQDIKGYLIEQLKKLKYI